MTKARARNFLVFSGFRSVFDILDGDGNAFEWEH